MIPLVASPSSKSTVLSPLTGKPILMTNIDRSVQSWLEDPLYSVDAFLQAGGRQAIAELMRENAEIPGRFGIPAGLALYSEFLGFRRSLTESERRHVSELWENNKTEKEPHFGDIENYMLSNASIFEKLSVLSSVNIISQGLLTERQEKELHAQLAAKQKEHGKEVAQPYKESAERAHGSQGGIQSKYDKLLKDQAELKDENQKLAAKNHNLNIANIKLAIENNRLRAEAAKAQATLPSAQ